MTTPVSFSGPAKEKLREKDLIGLAEPVRPRVPRRRRLWLVVIATVLAAGAAYGNYTVINLQDRRVPVLALARNVGWSQQITDADLTVAQAVPDPAVHLISADDRSRVVGMTAATTLLAGSVLTPAELTDHLVPAANQQLVGVLAKPGQLPARGVRPGDQVQVTPISGGQPSTSDGSAEVREPFTARVVDTGPPDANGAVTVDVVVPAARGNRASAAAAGPVVIALVGPIN